MNLFTKQKQILKINYGYQKGKVGGEEGINQELG